LKLPIFKTILTRLSEPRKFIQVLLGPRQVGKTTLALQVAEQLKHPNHYASADIAMLQDQSWLQTQWEIGRQRAQGNKLVLLIIDEVQKIQNWSATIKGLWDEDSRRGINLLVLLLGSSPWLMQRGLTESLAGRFEILPVTHWGFKEMKSAFGWTVDEYVFFGGYPGAAPFADPTDMSRWANYINDSLIETTLSRDILLMTQVNKPALLRRLFHLGCMYSGQILSYTKMLGQLQDVGNTSTLSHYLDLLSGAWVLTGLDKFAKQSFRRRASSPKFQVFNTALMSTQMGVEFETLRRNREQWGRLVESCVGAHLLSSTRQSATQLHYWKDGNYEVDFVLKRGEDVVAIEVKSGRKKEVVSGLDRFVSSFKPKRHFVVGKNGIPLDEFLITPAKHWFA